MVTESNIPDNTNTNELDLNNGGWIAIAILILIIIVLTITLIILHYRYKTKIESLQRRINSKLTNEKSELIEKTLRLDDNSKAKTTDILSEKNLKNPPKDGD